MFNEFLINCYKISEKFRTLCLKFSKVFQTFSNFKEFLKVFNNFSNF